MQVFEPKTNPSYQSLTFRAWIEKHCLNLLVMLATNSARVGKPLSELLNLAMDLELWKMRIFGTAMVPNLAFSLKMKWKGI